MASQPQGTRYISGLSAVMAGYDGVILDLWGVVHNGVALYPQTLDAFRALRAGGYKTCLLSNAPRRVENVVSFLTGLGLARDMYDDIVTSGEATHIALRDGLLQKYGRRCFHLGIGRNAGVCDGLDAVIVDDPATADFVLCTSLRDYSDGPDSCDAELAACLAAGLPMFCANPDRIVHIGSDLVYCAGTLAERYADMGGTVLWFGKPHPFVYDLVFARMGTRRLLAVGDAMVTDVAGADTAGIDSVLVCGGIHRTELQEPQNENHLSGFLQNYTMRPKFIFDQLKW